MNHPFPQDECFLFLRIPLLREENTSDRNIWTKTESFTWALFWDNSDLSLAMFRIFGFSTSSKRQKYPTPIRKRNSKYDRMPRYRENCSGLSGGQQWSSHNSTNNKWFWNSSCVCFCFGLKFTKRFQVSVSELQNAAKARTWILRLLLRTRINTSDWFQRPIRSQLLNFSRGSRILVRGPSGRVLTLIICSK